MQLDAAVRHVHGGGAGSAPTQSAPGQDERRAEPDVTVSPALDLTYLAALELLGAGCTRRGCTDEEVAVEKAALVRQ
jgi:hypothetical protein